ncbi:Lysosomal protective protein [Clonorchis sinensis]|uniref:Carboxypeptidase n=2 Tax=Clonorchis sinensis TaxID=79923 RepID=A0A8T1MH03_CLOSI|nr:Lysosomal protective protein [Clonorchis sinensis]
MTKRRRSIDINRHVKYKRTTVLWARADEGPTQSAIMKPECSGFLRQMLFLFLLVLYGFVSTVHGSDSYIEITEAAKKDAITYLPGLSEQPTFKQYSGYLSGETDNIQLHYWLVEATQTPDEMPLLLWLNGGPGCSSLGGLVTENGPFTVRKQGVLEYNPYSWNRFANVLYLESPGGVGFSYVKDRNLTTDDDFTAITNYHALLNFMKRFPQYKGRDFYITGESYAGVYVPLLTLRLLDNNFKDLNLKGIAVGNGYINKNFNDNSFLYYVYYHGLIDENLWNDLLASCCADRCSSKCMFSENHSVQCMNVISASNAATDGLDVYNIYAPCDGGVQTLPGRRSGQPRRSFRFVPEKQLLFRDNIFLKVNNASRSLGSRSITTCVDDTNQIVYFNTVDVRRALNVDVPEVDNWNSCSEQVAGSYTMTYNALQAQYMKILAYKVPTLLYAGDVDTACNYLGILWFVDDLGLKMHKPLKQWLYLDKDGTMQVGGVQKTLYLAETPLWYVTVRGSGHMVPQDKPIPAYHLITQFIQGIPL